MLHKETITLRKNGRFMGPFILDHEADGKPVYQYVYGKTYEEAEQKFCIARDIESQFLSGRHITVKKVYNEWLNAMVSLVNSDLQRSFASATYRNYIIRALQKSFIKGMIT